MARKLFISYSRRDSDFVNHLTADLEGRGFSVWIDREGIQGGDSWRKSIVDAISTCDVFLIVISPNSVSSRNVTKEISMADERGKRMLPIVIAPTEIPADMEYQLTGVQYLDFAAQPYPAAMERLLAAMGAAAEAGWYPSEVSGPGLTVGNQGSKAPARQPQPPSQPPPQQPQPQFSPVGVWQVQSLNMFGVVTGYGQLRMDPTGTFAGQFNTASGPMQMQGYWQMAGPQISLQGTYNLMAMPWQTLPYMLMLQVTGWGPAGFNAMANTGEQVTFQRVG